MGTSTPRTAEKLRHRDWTNCGFWLLALPARDCGCSIAMSYLVGSVWWMMDGRSVAEVKGDGTDGFARLEPSAWLFHSQWALVQRCDKVVVKETDVLSDWWSLSIFDSVKAIISRNGQEMRLPGQWATSILKCFIFPGRPHPGAAWYQEAQRISTTLRSVWSINLSKHSFVAPSSPHRQFIVY